MEESIRQKVRACQTCEESQRLRYDGEPMDVQPIISLKPGNRLVADLSLIRI